MSDHHGTAAAPAQRGASRGGVFAQVPKPSPAEAAERSRTKDGRFATPEAPPWPLELKAQASGQDEPAHSIATAANTEDVVELVDALPAITRNGVGTARWRMHRRATVRKALRHLQVVDGSTWQRRWERSGLEQRDDWQLFLYGVSPLPGEGNRHARSGSEALAWLMAADVIRPTLRWLIEQRIRLPQLAPRVLGVRDPAGYGAIQRAAIRIAPGVGAAPRLTRITTRTLTEIVVAAGKTRVADVLPDDLSVHGLLAESVGIKSASAQTYNAMGAAGFLPAGLPLEFRETLRVQRVAPREMVAASGIKSTRIRKLFESYFTLRGQGLDHSTLVSLHSNLIVNFWTQIEEMEEGIDTLEIPSRVFSEWQERVRTIQSGTNRGKERTQWPRVLAAVRSFYDDVAGLAATHQEFQGWHVLRNPLGDDVQLALSKLARQTRARMHDRSRVRLPLIPVLLQRLEADLVRCETIADVALSSAIGDRFEVQGRIFLRRGTKQIPFARGHGGMNILSAATVLDEATGKLQDPVHRADVAFWRWAAVTILAETGIRIEEFQELSVGSIVRHYSTETGEELPVLRIAPSKMDEERLILLSPEAAYGLGRVVDRLTQSSPDGLVPLVTRFDEHERVWSEPSRLLFQRRVRGYNRGIQRAWMLRQLRAASTEFDIRGEDGEVVRFTNHDFRRLFATRSLREGVPIQTIAKMMGHASIATTQRYAAVFDDDVIDEFRRYLDRRKKR